MSLSEQQYRCRLNCLDITISDMFIATQAYYECVISFKSPTTCFCITSVCHFYISLIRAWGCIKLRLRIANVFFSYSQKFINGYHTVVIPLHVFGFYVCMAVTANSKLFVSASGYSLLTIKYFNRRRIQYSFLVARVAKKPFCDPLIIILVTKVAFLI